MKLFGKSKLTQDQLQRQAAEELDAAVARATPPTDAQRTWVLPTPDVPDLRPRRPRPATWPRGQAPVDAEVDAEEEAPAPPARRRPSTPKAAGATSTAKKPATKSRTKTAATRANSRS